MEPRSFHTWIWWIHAARVNRREQKSDNVLHTAPTQTFQEAALWSEQSGGDIINEEVRKVVYLEPNAISIYNDVLVFGAIQEEHYQALRHILQLWRSLGLTLNMKKSRFNLRSLTFFGKVFSSKGIPLNPNKVAALQAAGPSQSQAEVGSFLFFTEANADFREGFAQMTAPLRDRRHLSSGYLSSRERLSKPKRCCQGTRQ